MVGGGVYVFQMNCNGETTLVTIGKTPWVYVARAVKFTGTKLVAGRNEPKFFLLLRLCNKARGSMKGSRNHGNTPQGVTTILPA